MLEAALILVGLLVGGAVGVYVGALRARRSAETGAARTANDLAAASATLAEVRIRLAEREKELHDARSAMESERIAGAEARARLESAREHFAEQRRQLEEMEKKMKEAFEALSAAALKNNNEQFAALAEAKLKPLRENLERYEKQILAMEEKRARAYGGLDERLAAMGEREAALQSQTAQLVSALRQTGAKGRWGEISLRRIVELAGLTEHCDFDEQVSTATEGGRLRPDMIVHLPGGQSVVVDAKVNTSAYLDAVAAEDDAERRRHLERFAATVRSTMRQLSTREYWKQFSPSPEFVVMFIPGEAFFSAAVAQDGDLIAEAVGQRVIVASPTTLIALLRAVAYGWQQQQAAENAERIVSAGRDLYDRLCVFVKHLDRLRDGLEKAAGSFNDAVGSWSSRTLPAARRLKDLGAADANAELADLPTVDVALRHLPAEDAARPDTADRVG